MVETDQLLYLYCLTDREPELKQTEALENDLYSVHCNGLYAVVRTVEQQEFDEEGIKRNMADFQWAKARAGAHERIIEQVMTDVNVIPFKFGTLFGTEGSLRAMLEQYEAEFKAILAKLTDKHEWGLKIYCDREKLKAGFQDVQGTFLKLEDEIKTSSVGKGYFLQKKKEAMTETALREQTDECGRASFDLLRPLSSEACINRLLPKEVTERQDEMVLNAAFLVDKHRTDEFLNTVKRLKTRYEDKGFAITCSGPWPPYNFCGLSGAR
jgi:Gas vesicle synthesis protein GvpL/GvpF